MTGRVMQNLSIYQIITFKKWEVSSHQASPCFPIGVGVASWQVQFLVAQLDQVCTPLDRHTHTYASP